MSAELERCSARSLAFDEPLHGTASTIRTWLLLEQPGPWGARPLRENRLPGDVGRGLERLSREHGVRVLLIRRHGRSATGRATCFVAHSGPAETWIERALLDDPRGALDLDLSSIRRGQRPGLEPFDGPLFLVCTNGRRDPCCAELGRPLAAAIDQRFPERTWESSHIGGDRFAGNLVCLPHGVYYGRVAPGDGARIAEAYERGRIDLDHYRGRSCHEFPVQAAEVFLRQRERLLGVDEVRLEGHRHDAGEIHARFAATSTGIAFEVRVRITADEPARVLTCHATQAQRPPRFELAGIARSEL